MTDVATVAAINICMKEIFRDISSHGEHKRKKNTWLLQLLPNGKKTSSKCGSLAQDCIFVNVLQ
jgi:hypothetical protein